MGDREQGTGGFWTPQRGTFAASTMRDWTLLRPCSASIPPLRATTPVAPRCHVLCPPPAPAPFVCFMPATALLRAVEHGCGWGERSTACPTRWARVFPASADAGTHKRRLGLFCTGTMPVVQARAAVETSSNGGRRTPNPPLSRATQHFCCACLTFGLVMLRPPFDAPYIAALGGGKGGLGGEDENICQEVLELPTGGNWVTIPSEKLAEQQNKNSRIHTPPPILCQALCC